MMNVLILGHSFATNLRRLCENPEKPHEWEDPGNARGKVSVQMHGYPGGRVKTLITAIEAGLFVHYTPHGATIAAINVLTRKPSKQIWILSLMLALRGEYWGLYSCLF